MADILIRIRSEGGQESASDAEDVGRAIGEIEEVAEQVAVAVVALTRALEALAESGAGEGMAAIARETHQARETLEGTTREVEEQRSAFEQAARTVVKWTTVHAGMGLALKGTRAALREVQGETRHLSQVTAAAAAMQARQFASMKVAAAGLAAALLPVAAAVAAVGAAFVAARVAQRTIEIARAGAEIQPVRRAFERLAEQADTTGDALLRSLSRAARGTIPQVDLMRQAVIALNAEAVESGEQFAELVALSRILGQTVGLEATQAIDNATRGIATQNPILLKNLGVLVSARDAQERYAESIGRTVGSLTAAEKRTAFQQAAVEELREAVARVADQEGVHSQRLEHLNATLHQLVPGMQAYQRVLSQIAAETAGLTTASELQDSLAAIETMGVDLRQRMREAFAESPQLNRAFAEFLELLQRMEPILDLQVRRMELLGQAAGVLGRGVLLFGRVLAGASDRARDLADQLVGAVNPFLTLRRETEAGIDVLRAYRDEIDQIMPADAAVKAQELEAALASLRTRMDAVRTSARELGLTHQEALVAWAGMSREVRELESALDALRSRALQSEIEFRVPHPDTLAEVLEGLDPDVVHRQLEAAEREVERFQTQLAALRLQEVRGFVVDPDDLDALTANLSDAEESLRRWRDLAVEVGPALGEALDLSAIDLSGLDRPLSRIREQLERTREESLETRERLATVLAEVARAPRGSELWKTLTDEVRRSREEVDRLELRLQALGDRADQVIRDRAADLGRIVADIQLRAPQIDVQGLDTPQLEARMRAAQLQVHRLSVEMSRLRQAGGGTSVEMDQLQAAMARARDRVGDLRRSLDALDFGRVEAMGQRAMTVRERVDSVMRALESLQDFDGQIDPNVMAAARRQLEEAGLSTAQVERALSSLNSTLDFTQQAVAAAANSVGSAVQAMIRGTDRMAESMVQAATQIAQTAAQLEAQRRAAAGIAGAGALGMAGVGIGVFGGILGALVSRGNRPQPVSIDSLSPRAENQMNRRREGPDTLILRVVGSDGRLEETEYTLRRRQSRDAAIRLPRGVSL